MELLRVAGQGVGCPVGGGHDRSPRRALRMPGRVSRAMQPRATSLRGVAVGAQPHVRVGDRVQSTSPSTCSIQPATTSRRCSVGARGRGRQVRRLRVDRRARRAVPLLERCPNRFVLERTQLLDADGDHVCFVGKIMPPRPPTRFARCACRMLAATSMPDIRPGEVSPGRGGQPRPAPRESGVSVISTVASFEVHSMGRVPRRCTTAVATTPTATRPTSPNDNVAVMVPMSRRRDDPDDGARGTCRGGGGTQPDDGCRVLFGALIAGLPNKAWTIVCVLPVP